jgi:hypothetical protein
MFLRREDFKHSPQVMELKPLPLSPSKFSNTLLTKWREEDVVKSYIKVKQLKAKLPKENG